jgi:phosphoadenosine phosphosulfate reductase
MTSMASHGLVRATPADVEHPPDIEDLSAEEVLAYAVERFHPALKVATSFQKEASVIMHMLLQIEPEARFFTLDTGLFFPETYDTWKQLEDRYDIQIETAHGGMSLARQEVLYGPEFWKRDPEACCGIRKVKPMREALADCDAWVTGLRRDQSPTRTNAPKLGWDKKHGLWKIAPLATWTDKDVWNYIAKHDIPYNELHDRGYASIGCTPCTKAGSGREGRWADSNRLECGLH